MQIIRTMVLGDVHLPTSARKRRQIDDKDKSFPAIVKGFISESPLKAVLKQAHTIIDKLKIPTIVAVGDLTDYGNIEHYESCVSCLYQALVQPFRSGQPLTTLVCVPGNHDVNRDLARQPGLARKFLPLNKALASFGIPSMPNADALSFDLSASQASSFLFSLNSCWGCGTFMEIPSEFRAPLKKAIDETVDTKKGKAIEQYYNHQLDTPAFALTAIQDLQSKLSSIKRPCMPVVLAHHNLLPQRITRIAPYTELINSGGLRNALLETGLPIIYIHGHTHDESVEVITSPGGGSVAVICAPLITDGFDVLELAFTESGMPIGVRIRSWRFSKSGMIGEVQSRNVPLNNRFTHLTEPGYSMFFGKLLQKNMLYWNDVIAIANHSSLRIAPDAAKEYLELLYFEGRVTIDHFSSGVQHWVVRTHA